MEHESFRSYKSATDKFRHALKQPALDYESEQHDKLDSSWDVDKRVFWTRLCRGKKKQQISSLLINNKQIRDPTEISNATAMISNM